MFQTLRDLATELGAKITIEECTCHGIQAQLEGFLEPEVPLVILESPDGYHVLIGEQVETWRSEYPPLPVDEQTMLKMLRVT